MAAAPASTPNSWQKLGVLLALYGALLLFLAGHLSLWLDEILGLIGVRYARLDSLIEYLSKMPGGVPLAYAIQWAVVKLLGYSVWSGRLTSVLCSLLACLGVFLLARRVPAIRHPVMAVLVYCVLPLQFRYAIEARPYGVALCASVWATVCFFRLLEKLTAGRALSYGVCIVAGLYSQPYTFFVPLSHLGWTVLNRKGGSPKFRGAVAAAIALSATLFLPWYVYSRAVWEKTAASYHSHIDWKSGLLILHELIGAGYIGTLVVLVACAFGIRTLATREQRWFWSLYLLLPIAGAVAGDLLFGYFLAIRQMLFIVAPMAVLCAAAMENLGREYSRFAACAATVLLFATLLVGNISFLVKPREDWARAAAILSADAAKGACAVFVPDDASLYEFFDPRAGKARCSQEAMESAREVVLAVNPYEEDQLASVIERLTAAGFRRVEVRNPQKPEIYVYRRE